VLSEDALRRMGNVDRDLIEKRVRFMFDRWAHGDIDAMIEYLAPDVVLPSYGAWTGSTAPVRGRVQASRVLRQWGELVENIVTVIHEIVIDGDRAVVHRTAVGRLRETGRRYQCDFVGFFRFRDGLVVEFSDYPDAEWSKVAVNA
jgi:ketosteroid isomerase-like protein